MANHPTNHIQGLPTDLLADILSRIGQESSQQVVQTRVVCRSFYTAAFHPMVLRSASFVGFPVHPWNHITKVVFYHRCYLAGNPNVGFLYGVWAYFDAINVDLGLHFLEEAHNRGVLDASYIFGLINFASSTPEVHNLGLSILNTNFPHLPFMVEPSRKRLFNLLHQMWRRNPRPFAVFNNRCNEWGHGDGYNPHGGGWDDATPSCMCCFWSYELQRFAVRFHY